MVRSSLSSSGVLMFIAIVVSGPCARAASVGVIADPALGRLVH
jgi:hypothetical protein